MWKLLTILVWIGLVFAMPLAYRQADERLILEFGVAICMSAGVIMLWEISKEAYKNAETFKEFVENVKDQTGEEEIEELRKKKRREKLLNKI